MGNFTILNSCDVRLLGQEYFPCKSCDVHAANQEYFTRTSAMCVVSFLAFCFLVHFTLLSAMKTAPANLPRSLADLVTPEMLPHLYSDKWSYFYLPPATDGVKLFGRFSPKLLSEIMSVEGGKYRNMFLYSHPEGLLHTLLSGEREAQSL